MEPKFKVGDRVRISDERYLISNRGPQEYQIEDMKLLGDRSEWQYGGDWVNGIRESDLELVAPAAPEFSKGDLVEAVKGETVIRGRVRSTNNAYFWLTVDGIAATINHSEASGWAVAVIEKAAPKDVLPTEPGFYIDNQNDAWLLRADGEWFALTDDNATRRVLDAVSTIKPDNFAPFTRLVPEVKNA